MRGMLELQGLNSEVVCHGRPGLKLAKSRFTMAIKKQAPMYQIIVIDFSMQDMDGYQVTQAILRLYDSQRIKT